VQNQAYKSFNGLNQLEAGDTITVTHESGKQVYVVDTVSVVKEDEALIDLSRANTPGLTLSTCTTFGARDNRVVVRARPAN